MMKFDYENTKELGTGTKRLPAGGYIAKIMTVEDVTDKQYLLVQFDIAEGDYNKYYEMMFAEKGFWGLKHYASYKEKAQGLFKHFIESVKKSNYGYNWDFNEKTLEGKCVGLVLGYEEYIGNDGAVKNRIRIVNITSVDDIKSGNFTIPELKELPAEQKGIPTDMSAEDDSDLPF